MIFFNHYRSGKLYGIQYQMPGGESLPEHAHDSRTSHNIIVLRGHVVLLMENHAEHLFQGEVFDFDGSVRHKITAMEESEILNLFVNGMPDGYDRLPQSELQGVIP